MAKWNFENGMSTRVLQSFVFLFLNLQLESIPTADDYRLYTFDFDDLGMKDDDTIRATIRMFVDADLINQFKIPYEVQRMLTFIEK